MAEAIGLGASVIAFVGLAGQVAQGCQYIRGVLDDVKDAPDDLRALHTEIKLFELTLQSFRNVLIDLADSGIAISGDHLTAVELALEYSKETIAKLLELITKNNRFGGKWKRIRFAIAKDKCVKNVARVQSAKGYVVAAQANILLSLEHQQITDSRATHRSLGGLTSTLDTSSATISTLPSRLDDASLATRNTQQAVSQLRTDVSQRLQDLSAGVNAILTSNFTAFASMISETRARLDEVHHSVQQTQEAVVGLKSTSEGLQWLPLGMASMVKDTFRGVLVEFYHERMQSLLTEETAKRELVERLTLPPRQQATRRIIHQYTHTRKYIRAIGIITVQSTTTTFRERADLGNLARSNPVTSTVTQTNLELNPNPEILRMGVYGSFVQQGFATFDSPPEPKLRVFNVVDTDAQIVKACTMGQLSVVRNLFKAGRASPFDRIWGERSLLDLVFLQILSTFRQARPPASDHRLSGLLAVYDELVKQGLDPGVPRSNEDSYGPSPLSALSAVNVFSPQDCLFVTTLGRIVVANSIHDPTIGAKFHYRLWSDSVSQVENPLTTFLKSQEDWDICWPDIKDLKDEYYCKILDRIDAASQCDNLARFGFAPEDDPLKHIIAHEPNHQTLNRILYDCKDLEKKLKLTSVVVWIYWRESTNAETGVCSTSSFGLGNRLQDCLQSCLESGLNLYQPPLEFHELLRVCRVCGWATSINSVLLKLGVELSIIDDLLEVELYASMAYQLWTIAKLQHPEMRPPVLRYYPSLAGKKWVKFCEDRATANATTVFQDIILSSFKDAQYADSQQPPALPPIVPSPPVAVRPERDMIIQMLAKRAAIDLDFEQLMKIVLNDEATQEELKKFSAYVDELTQKYTSRLLVLEEQIKDREVLELVFTEEDSSSSDDCNSDEGMADDEDSELEDEDYSDEEMSDPEASEMDDHYDLAPSVRSDCNQDTLKIKGLQSSVWQEADYSDDAKLSSADNPLPRPTKRMCLGSSAEGGEYEEDDDGASSILSDILEDFDTECQKRDPACHNDNSRITEFSSKSKTGYQDSWPVSHTSAPDDDLNKDDSGNERLRGITIALNAFWT